MYRRLLAIISPLSVYVLHYGSQYFSELNKKESSVQLDFCCCALAVEIYFKYVLNNYFLLNDLTRKRNSTT